MAIFLLIIFGILGGILGGMGMGGGTLLIPLLTIFGGIEQHTAQGVNLIAFIPMAIVALIIHIKNKLIDFNGVLLIIIFGVVFSVGGAFIAKSISGDLLKKSFGVFLLLLSIYMLFKALKQKGTE